MPASYCIHRARYPRQRRRDALFQLSAGVGHAAAESAAHRRSRQRAAREPQVPSGSRARSPAPGARQSGRKLRTVTALCAVPGHSLAGKNEKAASKREESGALTVSNPHSAIVLGSLFASFAALVWRAVMPDPMRCSSFRRRKSGAASKAAAHRTTPDRRIPVSRRRSGRHKSNSLPFETPMLHSPH